jgi:hypothetical protein
MGGKIVNDCYYGVERWRYWYLFRGNYGAKTKLHRLRLDKGMGVEKHNPSQNFNLFLILLNICHPVSTYAVKQI